MEVPSSQETCTSLAEDGMLDSYSDVDDIKVISTQIIHLDLDVPVGSSVGINTIKETPEEEKRRKRINKVVGFCAALIFLTCVALVCSSLMRAKSIDELGKDRIRKLQEIDLQTIFLNTHHFLHVDVIKIHY